jgi:predicted small lipoprotein YifL
MLRWIATVLISIGLTACGQKGDLYLPPPATPLPTEQQAEQSNVEQPDAAPEKPAQP